MYIGDCTGLSGDLISNMTDTAEDLTYDEFIFIVSENELVKVFPDYDWNNGKNLKLRDDWAVSFHKSKYDGRDCLYVKWSAIEFVWIT